MNISSDETYIITGSPEHREIWMTRLREVCLGEKSCWGILTGTQTRFMVSLV